jgi:hypothetical protein
MTGQWSIEGRRDDRLWLELHKDRPEAWFSAHLPLTQFQGLTEELLVSSARVSFQLVREAGTFTFSGSFHDRAGTGEWTFNAAPAFLALLRRHGYELPTNEQLFSLAVSDVNAAYIDGLRSAGYDAISLNGIIALKSNGVTVPYIESLGDAGYRRLTASQLIALRTNRVDGEFIKRVEKRGRKNLTVGRLLSLRTNGC